MSNNINSDDVAAQPQQKPQQKPQQEPQQERTSSIPTLYPDAYFGDWALPPEAFTTRNEYENYILCNVPAGAFVYSLPL